MNKKPKFHFTAPKNWLNDPNGLTVFKGEYHMFYQHNPVNPYWGNMTWGHAKSKNLFDWEHLPHALEPGKDLSEDRDGCFSGSGFVMGDDLYLAYTGVAFEEYIYNEHGNKVLTHDDAMISTQIFAKSSDGINFQKLKKPFIKAPKYGDMAHFRDPKVWKKGDIWNMVVGSKYENKGKVLVYQSKDIKNWELKNEIQKENMGHMWECPDIFEIQEKHAMIFSPMGIGTQEQENLAGYMMGDFDYKNAEFKYKDFHLIDEGFEFYAPQTFEDDYERRILIGWLIMHSPFEGENWTGMMTLPREIKRVGEKLRFSVVKEFENYRKDCIKISDETQSKVIKRDKNLYDMELEFETNKDKEIILFENCQKGLAINFNSKTKTIILNRENVINGLESLKTFGVRRESTKIEVEKIKLRIIVDTSVVEIYVNDGEICMTAVVNPEKDQKNIVLNGSFSNICIWDIKK